MQRQLDEYTSRVEALENSFESANLESAKKKVDGLCTTVSKTRQISIQVFDLLIKRHLYSAQVKEITSTKACKDDGITCQDTLDMVRFARLTIFEISKFS